MIYLFMSPMHTLPISRLCTHDGYDSAPLEVGAELVDGEDVREETQGRRSQDVSDESRASAQPAG